MEKTLTIIVPAYNASHFLRKCLDSFCVPEVLPMLEILVINDGSTDDTESIAKEYEQKYPDSFKLISKENGGHGSGINVGAANAHGLYFKVIDADDWVISENLPAFLKALETATADVVLTNFHEIDMTSGRSEPWYMSLPQELYGKELSFPEFMEHWNELERVLQFHGITYRTEFYRKLNYSLLEHIFYEDQEYSTVPFSHAEKVLPLDLFIYEYLVGNTQQSVSDTNRVKRLWMLEKVIDQLLSGAARPDFSKLSAAQQEYFLKKLEGLVIDYYMISCILDDDKAHGRQLAKAFLGKIKAANPRLSSNTHKQYLIFRLANFLHLSPENYRRLLAMR